MVAENMCEVRCTVKPGLIESERVAIIPTATGGTEEVTVYRGAVTDNSIRAAFIGEDDGQVLIELPRESATGAWRVWVSRDQLVR
jgi:hypothetical protein